MGNGASKPCSGCSSMITSRMKGGSLCLKCSKIVCGNCSVRDVVESLTGDAAKKIRLCLVCKMAMDRLTVSTTSKHSKSMSISADMIGKPDKYEQQVHVEFDKETGAFKGMPEAWAELFNLPTSSKAK